MKKFFLIIFSIYCLTTLGQDTKLVLNKIITHKFPISSFDEAFKVINSGQCGKVIMEW